MSTFEGSFVDIQISMTQSGISRATFGNGMALTLSPYIPGTANGKPCFAVYGPDDVATNLGTNCPEYYAAVKYFSQSLVPDSLMIASLRMNDAVIKIVKGRVGHTYSVQFRDDAAVPNSVNISYLSATADKNTIASDIADAINALSGTHWTATAVNDEVTVVYNDSSRWWFIFKDDNEYITVQAHISTESIADFLTDLKQATGLWYHFGLIHRDAAAQLDCIEFANVTANMKYFHAATSDPDISGNVSNNLAEVCRENSYKRSEIFFHSNVIMLADENDYPLYGTTELWYELDPFPEFAWMGRMMPVDPDTSAATWAIKNLTGVAIDTAINTTIATALDANHVNRYISAYGIGVTTPGRSSEDTPIDVITTRDWTEARIGEAIFTYQASSEKIPMDDNGIAAIVAQIESHFKRGMNSCSPPHFLFNTAFGAFGYYVKAPAATDITTADRAARILRGVKAQAQLAGAIEKVAISINIVP